MSDANLSCKIFQQFNNAGKMSSYGNVIVSLPPNTNPINRTHLYYYDVVTLGKKNILKLFYRPVIVKYISNDEWTVWYNFKSLLTLSFNFP